MGFGHTLPAPGAFPLKPKLWNRVWMGLIYYLNMMGMVTVMTKSVFKPTSWKKRQRIWTSCWLFVQSCWINWFTERLCRGFFFLRLTWYMYIFIPGWLWYIHICIYIYIRFRFAVRQPPHGMGPQDQAPGSRFSCYLQHIRAPASNLHAICTTSEPQLIYI